MDDIKRSIEYFEKKVQKGVSQCRRKFYDTAISAMKELQQYRQIGTVEECRKAMEKNDFVDIDTSNNDMTGG